MFTALSLLCASLLLASDATAQAARGSAPIVAEPGGRVSASLQETPLWEVLQSFSDATGIQFVVRGSADEPISLELESLPPDEAIRAILGERGFIRFYANDTAAADASARKLTEVWVLRGVARPRAPSAAPRALRPAPPPVSSAGDPFNALKKRALTDGDPAVRRQAVESLLDADNERAKPALVQALLNDKDSGVRQAALEGLLWYDDQAPRQALTRAALRDADVEIRRQVIEEAFLDQAEEDRGARRVLVQALGDKDVDIRLSVVEALSNAALYDQDDPSVRQALARAARDADERVRLVAVESLEDNEMQEELRGLLEDDSEPVRSAAQEALNRLGGP